MSADKPLFQGRASDWTTAEWLFHISKQLDDLARVLQSREQPAGAASVLSFPVAAPAPVPSPRAQLQAQQDALAQKLETEKQTAEPTLGADDPPAIVVTGEWGLE